MLSHINQVVISLIGFYIFQIQSHGGRKFQLKYQRKKQHSATFQKNKTTVFFKDIAIANLKSDDMSTNKCNMLYS
jgi:hypothetical protein